MKRSDKRPDRFRQTQHFIAASCLVALVAAGITGFVWASKSITIVADGRACSYRTQAETVGSLLAEAGIPVHRGDIVNPGTDAAIADGDTIVLRHAVPVTVVLGNERVRLNVVGATVSDAVAAAGLDPTSGIHVSPSLETPLVPGMVVAAEDVFVRLVAEQRTLLPRSRTIQDPTLPVGTRRLVSQGAPGRMLRVLEAVVVGGRERGRMIKAERVLTPALETVIAVGTKRSFRGAEPGPQLFTAADFSPVGGRKLTVLATAYAPNAESGGPRGATGVVLGYGIIAVDPDVIPLGTQVFVPGYGFAVAADTGGAIKGDRIDVCFESERLVDKWGVRTVTITILP